MNYSTIEIEPRGAAAWLWMNRPDKHNAFDETLIAELDAALRSLNDDAAVRVVVLAGRGKSFSAGADLNWMKRQGAASHDENRADARRFGELFATLARMSKPTIARVHGAAMGGGLGLAAACHICIATQEASFATSEAQLGLIPAVISPYVLRAIGTRQAYRYFLTAERIPAARAREIGLVHEVIEAAQLDAQIQILIDALLSGGPGAQAASIALIEAVAHRPLDATLIDATAERIATVRATPEAIEGLSAFLEKRAPAWIAK